jgi:3,4-dihydroxy-2-butanone 4-phosphate synthase
MTDATVVQMVNYGRGLVSIVVDIDTAFRLGLRRMAGRRAGIPENGEYLVSIEAADCSGTGISAGDRAATLRAAGGRDAAQDDIVMPGHVMPLLVPGRLTRESALPTVAHAIVMRSTEYSVVAWCDVLGRDGDVADLNEASALARELQLPMAVADDVSTFTDGPGLSRAS